MGQQSSKKLHLNRGIIRVISSYIPRPIPFNEELISKYYFINSDDIEAMYRYLYYI